jgi:hypothetical protein
MQYSTWPLGGVLDRKWRHQSIERHRFPIRVPLTPNAYLLPFSNYKRYSTRPLGGVLDRKWRHQSIERHRFPISVPLTPNAYLLPFSRYLRSSISFPSARPPVRPPGICAMTYTALGTMFRRAVKNRSQHYGGDLVTRAVARVRASAVPLIVPSFTRTRTRTRTE